MSIPETMKEITKLVRELIKVVPKYKVGDFVHIYGYESPVRIDDVLWDGASYYYQVNIDYENEFLYDDDIAELENE